LIAFVGLMVAAIQKSYAWVRPHRKIRSSRDTSVSVARKLKPAREKVPTTFGT